MEPLKSPTYIHFWRKIFMDSRQFFALLFWDFLRILYAYYAERKFCHKYTHALSPVWNRPLYTRIICEKNFAPDIYENCGAFGIRGQLIERWYLCIRLYHVLYMRSSFEKVVFVDWSMSKFGYKSVMGLHKFIVKMWLCICNCICICVCIWYWLWFCYRLNLGSHQVVVELM